MTPDVERALTQDQQSPFHLAMLSHCMNLVKMSRCEMSKHYLDWDRQDQVYRGERWLDKDDIEASRQQKPTKMVVPNTFAQVMTFTSFNFLMMTQGQTFYELKPNGDEDYGTRFKDSEKILEANCRFNEYNRLLFQELLDTSRFGVGVTSTEWTRKLTRAYVTPEPQVINYNGVDIPVRQDSQWQEFVKYEGNLVRNVSPYKFFPDTRQTLAEFQKGEFCACEEEYSKGLLRDLERAGEITGVDLIQPLPTNWLTVRGGSTRLIAGLTSNERGVFLRGPSQSEGTVLVTKLQVWIVPSKFKIDGDKPLGPETFPILYHVWYANDNRVIRCEPCYWWHNEFSWTVSQFTPDMHRTVNLGLADLIYKLQEVITWLINARVTDVRKNLRGRNVINPSIIDTKTLDGDGDIFLRKGANGAMMDRGILPLAVPNVTQGHFDDADTLSKIMEVVTGVNGNAMGQYSSGRRSAREVAQVSSGASGRMKMHGQLIWETGPGRRGRLMLSNLRQSLSEDYFYRIIGTPKAPEVDPQTGQQMEAQVPDRFATWHGTPEDVIAGQDFFVFDSTLSSEKGFIAQSLQDLVGIILSNPDAATQLDIDPRVMISEIQFLRGAGNVSRFSLSQAAANGLPPLPPPPQPPPPPTPEQQIAASVKYVDLPPTTQMQVLQAVGLEPGTILEHQIGKISTTRKAPGITIGENDHIVIEPVEKAKPEPATQK